ncbi:DUF1302 domain-containing protein [Oxalobacteraceae bacterium OTU3CAMAD1]|nr:DUF1302 domain-containing protein [Oxalobacteraceae bacterium OTU3CAMAD1]
MQKSSRQGQLRLAVGRCAFAGAALAAAPGQAVDLDTGNPDVALRFDNTVKASTIYRLHDADPSLVNTFNANGSPQALNFNAGDQNFRNAGVVSQRVDLLSELDLVYKRDFGLRVSGAAWYDRAYHRDTDAASDPTLGQQPYNRFQSYTRKMAGEKAELLDAFVFGGVTLDGGGKVSARLGRHALVYGESLFFGDNAIAAAQGPTDIAKLLASPNAQFKEIVRPVPQLSAQWQVTPNVSIGGYLQFRWEESRVPPAGSYFSSANIPWNSTGPEYVGIPAGPVAGNYVLMPGGDEHPRDSGQFGLQLKWRLDETDLGFYFARYHDKFGQLFGRLNPGAPATDSRWYFVFGDDIKVAAISASRSVGDFNVSAEASVRDNMPLVVNNAIYFGPAGTPRPAIPVGRTAHLNLSTLATFGPNFIASESAFVAEAAWNRRLSMDDPNNELDKGRTRDASIVQFTYTPTYRQALPGLDLSVPIGARYTLSGRSSVTAWGPRHTGNASIGLDGNYLNVWQISLNYNHYIGASVPSTDYRTTAFGDGNPLGDRDYVSLSVRRTF